MYICAEQLSKEKQKDENEKNRQLSMKIINEQKKNASLSQINENEQQKTNS